MVEDYRKQIQQIMGDMRCAKDFKCAKSGFSNLCRALDVGLEHQLLCLEDNPSDCMFCSSSRGGYLCDCPLRVYIAKKLGR